MRRYRLKGGAIITVASSDEAVSALFSLMFFAPATERTYMRKLAVRAKLWNGTEIDWKTSDRFIDSLIKAGLINELK